MVAAPRTGMALAPNAERGTAEPNKELRTRAESEHEPSSENFRRVNAALL
jgi:hypothetical protein